MWRRAIAPIAEWVARKFWVPYARRDTALRLPTRLTQRHKREAKGADPLPAPVSQPRKENICRGCGKTIGHEFTQFNLVFCRDVTHHFRFVGQCHSASIVWKLVRERAPLVPGAHERGEGARWCDTRLAFVHYTMNELAARLDGLLRVKRRRTDDPIPVA